MTLQRQKLVAMLRAVVAVLDRPDAVVPSAAPSISTTM